MDYKSIQKTALKVIAILSCLFVGMTSQMHAQGLNVHLASSTTSAGAGDPLHYTLMASNTGTNTLENVVVEVRIPSQVAGFRNSESTGERFNCGTSTCSSGETVTWDIGTLQIGDNRQMTYPTNIIASPTEDIAETVVVASADNISDIIFTHSVVIDPSPLLRLSLVAGPGPAIPGEPLKYKLTYGNIGSTAPGDVLLSMPLPDGTSFVSASDGGMLNDGVISWPLGTVGVGAGGRTEITVLPESGLSAGETINASATIDSGIESEENVSSESLIEVGAKEDLHFQMALSQNAVSRSGVFSYTFTATNSGSTDLMDAYARIRLPRQINRFRTNNATGSGFRCGTSTCSEDETIQWEIGTLAPSQSRTISIRTYVDDDAQQGDILRLFYQAGASDLNEQTGGVDIVVDPSPVTNLRLIPGPGPAQSGELFTYDVLFSNIGFQPTDIQLDLMLPDGTSFVSANKGGIESSGVVSWIISDVTEESLGQVQATVLVNESLAEGTILKAEASLDTGSATEYALHSEATMPVKGNIPLSISYSSDISDGLPGDPLSFRMEAENTGSSDLTDVLLNFRMPSQINRFSTGDVIGSGLRCGTSTCSADETITWEVGILAPGQSRTIIMPTNIAGDAPEGSFMLSPVVATATGSNEVLLYNEILVGTPVNFPPSAAVITSPEDGASLVIGSDEGEEPDPADTPFVVEWEASTDPEQDNLSYTWQLSTSSDFNTLLVNSPSLNSGADTQFETDYATLSTLLSDNGVDVGGSIELYHRVVTSDGSNTVEGDAFSVTLTRGLITNLDMEPGIPREFALYNNYPNPFNPKTTFSFDLPELAAVELMVYDMIGRRVATIVSEELPAGQFQFTWDAGHLSSGVYLYRLKAGSFTQTNKLVLLK